MAAVAEVSVRIAGSKTSGGFWPLPEGEAAPQPTLFLCELSPGCLLRACTFRGWAAPSGNAPPFPTGSQGQAHASPAGATCSQGTSS